MSFARTKIQPPRPRTGLLLPRPDLERALVSALSSERVVLVCAPAGYGKTALLVRAVGQLPADHVAAWVSLDEGDDLHRLLDCLTAALEPFDLPWRTSPEGLVATATRTGNGTQLLAVADEIVNTLDACDVAHGLIVLDDAHHLSDPACVAFLDHFLQRVSPRWTVALAARHEPPLRLARLRAAGELADFRERRLRFARDEVRALAAGAGIDAASADALHARTAGWPAGMRLALNGARGGSPGSAIDRPAFDFLATEVLARIDPALRDFLLLTSVLHDLDPPRCAAVSGHRDAARWLEEIERLGLFASVVDDTLPTLRLHDLFRDALQHRLRLERPNEWPQQLERAAAVEPDPVRRQSLLLAGSRPEQAAQALLAAGPQLITQGAVNTLLQLCGQFPPGFGPTSAEWQRVSGMAKWTVWDAHAAERHFAHADALYTARGDTGAAQTARGHRCVVLIGIGRLAEAGNLLASLQGQPLQGEARIVTLVAAGWHAMERGDRYAAAPLFEQLVQTLETMPVLEAWYFSVPPPRQTDCRGIAPAMARWAAGALAVAGERPVPLRAMGLLTQGWLALWQGRLAEVEDLLQRAEADAQWTGQQVVARSHALSQRAFLHAVRGERDAALRTLRTRIAEYPPAYGDWGMWHILVNASRAAAACSDAAALREWLQRALAQQQVLPDAWPARLRPVQALQGTLAALEGRRGEAVALWRAALEHEEQIDLFGQAREVRVRLALALVQARLPTEAVTVLAPLLADLDASPGGVLLAGDALCELAATGWGGALAQEQAGLLRRWAAVLRPSRGAASASVSAATHADERLSPREVEVLRQIAEGASNKAIARALDLSPHTVKRHVAHILDKLVLASRGQAAAWYRGRQPAPVQGR